MKPEEINQALRLTIEELSRKLADEVTSKNLLAIQLTQKKEATTPLKIDGGKKDGRKGIAT